MSKHTAGKWIYYTHPQPNGCPIVGTENGLMVCQLAHSIDTNAVEALANAKLISAAPSSEQPPRLGRLWNDRPIISNPSILHIRSAGIAKVV